jgi:hypothetical protein
MDKNIPYGTAVFYRVFAKGYRTRFRDAATIVKTRAGRGAKRWRTLTARFGRRPSDSTATYAVYSMSFGRQTAQQSDRQSAAVAMRAVSIVLTLLLSFVLIPAITHQ